MQKRMAKWFSILALWVGSSSLPAQPITLNGTVDAVYLDENRIVINDQNYALSRNVVVLSESNTRFPLRQLKAGQTVRYTYKGAGSGIRGDVSEIVVMHRAEKHRD